MKFLIHAPNFKPNVGGVAEYTHQLSKNLQKRGHKVVVLSRCYEKKYFNKEKYVIERYNLKKIKRSSYLLSKILLYKKLSFFINKHKPDVLISNSFNHEANIVNITCKIKQIPHCLVVHGNDISYDKRKYNFVLEGLRKLKIKTDLYIGVNKSDVIFANSKYTKSKLLKKGVSGERLFVLNPGISRDFLEYAKSMSSSKVKKYRNKINVDKSQSVILSVGRLIKRKGFDRVIKAISLLSETEKDSITYIIAGKGEYKVELERLVERLNLNEVVNLLGYVSEKEKHKLYYISDVFVMPNVNLKNDTDIEGFGIVLLEAGAHNTPVIAGTYGGTSDAIIDGKTGTRVDSKNIQTIKTAILNLKNSNIKNDEIRNVIEEKFLWEKRVKKFVNKIKKTTL